MKFDHLRRRELIMLMGVAATWPLAAVARQPTLPASVIPEVLIA
jgi:hypothetical protein